MTMPARNKQALSAIHIRPIALVLLTAACLYLTMTFIALAQDVKALLDMQDRKKYIIKPLESYCAPPISPVQPVLNLFYAVLQLSLAQTTPSACPYPKSS